MYKKLANVAKAELDPHASADPRNSGSGDEDALVKSLLQIRSQLSGVITKLEASRTPPRPLSRARARAEPVSFR